MGDECQGVVGKAADVLSYPLVRIVDVAVEELQLVEALIIACVHLEDALSQEFPPGLREDA